MPHFANYNDDLEKQQNLLCFLEVLVAQHIMLVPQPPNIQSQQNSQLQVESSETHRQ